MAKNVVVDARDRAVIVIYWIENKQRLMAVELEPSSIAKAMDLPLASSIKGMATHQHHE
jgi:hypothetical protein